MAAWLLMVSIVGPRSIYDVNDEAGPASYSVRRRDADEILETVYHLGETRGRRRHLDRHRRRPARPLHFHMLNLAWVAILAVLLIYTIATVEVTIGRDQVDFVRPALRDTAEVLVFLVGLVVLVLVAWTVVEAIFQFGFRRRETQKVRTPPIGSHEELWRLEKEQEAQRSGDLAPGSSAGRAPGSSVGRAPGSSAGSRHMAEHESGLGV